LRKAVREATYDKVYAVAKSQSAKHERSDAFEAIKEEFIQSIPEEEREAKMTMISRYYHAVEKEAMRNMILNEGIRLDGRKTDQIRPIACEVDYLPAAHGSALFTRGETQSLTTVTLGTKLDEKQVDEVLYRGTEKLFFIITFHRFQPVKQKLHVASAVAK
jgi:polyribonucleotide nucleotidyltransferase